MSDFGDQAEGLRRLLGRGGVRVITVAGGQAVGKTSAVINIAAALATRGKKVLVIDENYGPANVAGLLGIRPRFDLQQAIRQTCTLEDALVGGPSGITVLPAAHGTRAYAGLRHLEQERLISGFGRLDKRFDLVLIDTRPDGIGKPGVMSSIANDMIIMSYPSAAVITEAYALIKRMRERSSEQRFHVLLNRVVSEPNARTIFNNMQSVAEQHLDTALESLGHIPNDAALRQARQSFQSVIAAAPSSPAARRYMRIAEAITTWPQNRDHEHGLDSFIHKLLINSRYTFANAGV